MLGKVTEEAASIPAGTRSSTPIYRWAIPGIAGPGAMLTVVLLTDNNTRTFKEQATTTGELVLCMVAAVRPLCRVDFCSACSAAPASRSSAACSA